MAECCIHHYREKEDALKKRNANRLVRKHLPPGNITRGHRLLLPIPTLPSQLTGDDAASRDLALPNAVRWLQLADSILQREDSSIPPERRRKLHRLTLLKLIYCLIGSGCPVQAIQDCERVIKMMQKEGKVDEQTKFIVHQYWAEAMCMAGRTQEATSKLDPNDFPMMTTPQGIPGCPEAAYQ